MNQITSYYKNNSSNKNVILNKTTSYYKNYMQ